MKVMSGIHELNVATLLELKSQIGVLATTIDEIISLNEHAVSKSNLARAPKIEPIPGDSKPISVAKEVRRLLQIAGCDGTTAEEIIHIMSKKRPVVPQTVRCALRRCRELGTAKSVGRRWYYKD
jgi:hypothetical protein